MFNSSLRKKYLSKFNNIYIPSDIFHQIAHSSFLQRRFLQINKHPSKNLIYPDEETNSFSKMNTLILLFILSNRSKPEFEFYLSDMDTIWRQRFSILLRRYDLMIGVVRSEAYFALTADDAQYGIEADRRTKILREFVRNTYTYHQAEILATIINEYTDWERPVQHPVNIKWAQRLSLLSFLPLLFPDTISR